MCSSALAQWREVKAWTLGGALSTQWEARRRNMDPACCRSSPSLSLSLSLSHSHSIPSINTFSTWAREGRSVCRKREREGEGGEAKIGRLRVGRTCFCRELRVFTLSRARPLMCALPRPAIAARLSVASCPGRAPGRCVGSRSGASADGPSPGRPRPRPPGRRRCPGPSRSA